MWGDSAWCFQMGKTCPYFDTDCNNKCAFVAADTPEKKSLVILDSNREAKRRIEKRDEQKAETIQAS